MIRIHPVPPLLLALGIVVAPAAGAQARELVLRLQPASEPTGRVSIEVEVSPRSAQRAEPIRRAASVFGVLEVPGLAPGLWEIRAVAEGWWGPSEVVEISGEATAEPAEVVLTLWPTATLAGTLRAADGSGFEELRVRFEPLGSGPGKGIAPHSGQVRCFLSEGSFSCAVPAGRWDLRFAAPRFASHYFWDRGARPGGRLDLGEVAFVSGASVVGRVPVCAVDPPDPSCQVALEPWTPAGAGSARGERRLAAQRLEAAVDGRGFFQVRGVPPGSYLLTARRDGYAPERVFPVRVLEGAESELARPVDLQRPGDLEVGIDPPRSPSGDPWSIELREVGMGGTGRPVAREAASAEGRWKHAGLTPGAHRLIVADDGGNRWIDLEVEVSGGPNEVTVTVPLVLIEGAVRLGDRPLPGAEIWFGGRHHRQRVRAWTDDEGAYATHLPRPGAWGVEIRGGDDEVRRALRNVEVPEDGGRLDFDLADTEISGTVVDPEGRPAEGAAVVLAALDHLEVVPDAVTGEDGRFRARGLEYGGVGVGARLGDLQAEELRVELSAAAPAAEVRLVLERLREVEGRVVTREGRGVPGTGVDWTATGSLGTDHVVTGIDGGFALSVPANYREVDLRLFPPGYAFTTQRVAIGEGPLVLVVDDVVSTLALEPGFDALAALLPKIGGTVLFFRGPVFFTLADLRRWTALQRSLAELPVEEMTVPAVAPGELTVCAVADDALWPLYRHGDRGAGPCRSVDLPAGGSAVLDLAELVPAD